MNTTVCKNYALQGDDANDAASLTGDEFEDKVEKAWHSCPVARKKFKALIKRSDGVPLRYFGLWLALLIGSGIVACMSWGIWWAIPAFLFMAFSIPQPVIATTFAPTLAGDGGRGGANAAYIVESCQNV
jgi:hypothetical protein